MLTIRLYLQENGTAPYQEWEDSLDGRTAARVVRYVKRMEQGNFGNSAPVGSGVSELKIDMGPGYRVYYGKDGNTLVILLGGGSKKRQSRDIRDAIERWKLYKKSKKQQDRTKNT